MLKVGFIDNFLSEWHANNYPLMFEKSEIAARLGVKVCYAYAKCDVSPYDGVSTDEWCQKFGVERINAIPELVDKSDVIVVLSPDNPELHEELSEYALKSGKPVYIDKTFAESKESAEKMFAIAQKHGTPMYSSSALRFAGELDIFKKNNIGVSQCVVSGPRGFAPYAIHIFEIMCVVMKSGAKRIMCLQNGNVRSFAVDYGNGRVALYNQNESPSQPFSVSYAGVDGASDYFEITSKFFDNFINALLVFFETKQPQADCKETVDLMGMLEKSHLAVNSPFVWFDI